jgi:hypothetical protein
MKVSLKQSRGARDLMSAMICDTAQRRHESFIETERCAPVMRLLYVRNDLRYSPAMRTARTPGSSRSVVRHTHARLVRSLHTYSVRTLLPLSQGDLASRLVVQQAPPTESESRRS